MSIDDDITLTFTYAQWLDIVVALGDAAAVADGERLPTTAGAYRDIRDVIRPELNKRSDAA